MAEKKEKRYVSDNAQLMAEWNYEKNAGLTPADVTHGSHKKVWWKCSKGHEWQAEVNKRTVGTSCPYCSGLYPIKGETDLQTVNPALAKEWNYEKNAGLTPADVMPGSRKKVWWKCSKGHEWQAEVNWRTSGNGCPYCSGRYPIKGETDLQTVNPTLAKEWNYEKNAGLTPADVTPGSNKKVWWKCSEGHEWQTLVSGRTAGTSCPYCSGRYAIKGETDLQTVDPALAKEWNYEKNAGLTPADVMPGSHKKVWWKCSEGHEWQTSVNNRNSGSSCPYCSGRYAIKGETDLQTVNPSLAKEWNYEKNAGLTPADVMPGSHKKVWWKCDKGHEWQALVSSRNHGAGCPLCARGTRKKS